MNLSPHFTLEELSFSEIALRKGLVNTPEASHVANLTDLCQTLLEPIRLILGVPLHVNSAYRSPAVNTAIGGAISSAHLDGRAADIVPIGLALPEAFTAIRIARLPLDQVILECNAWIHVSIAPRGRDPRHQALTATGHPGAWHYQPV